MGIPKLSIALICFITLALIQSSHAQTGNTPQDYLDAHNNARANVSVGNIVWSTTLESYAQNYANSMAATCNLQHSMGPYGENLAKGSSSFLTGTYAVGLWVAEKADYNYATNTCNAGKVCGHYTQVVWKNSLRLGCGRVQCTNGWYYVVCSYDPPGNYVGQKPY